LALGGGGGTFSGSIPSELGKLIQLKEVYLNTNSLSGTIPASLGSLVEVESLALHGNNLQGTVLASLGVSNLKRLKILFSI